MLRVVDLITENTYEIKGFQTPQAFVYIYERDMMLGLKDGRFLLYDVKSGEQISNFNLEKAYTHTPTLSDDRKLLFAVVKEKDVNDVRALLLNEEQASYINVVDLKSGEIKSRIHCQGRMNLQSKQLERVKSPLET